MGLCCRSRSGWEYSCDPCKKSAVVCIWQPVEILRECECECCSGREDEHAPTRLGGGGTRRGGRITDPGGPDGPYGPPSYGPGGDGGDPWHFFPTWPIPLPPLVPEPVCPDRLPPVPAVVAARRGLGRDSNILGSVHGMVIASSKTRTAVEYGCSPPLYPPGWQRGFTISGQINIALGLLCRSIQSHYCKQRTELARCLCSTCDALLTCLGISGGVWAVLGGVLGIVSGAVVPGSGWGVAFLIWGLGGVLTAAGCGAGLGAVFNCYTLYPPTDE